MNNLILLLVLYYFFYHFNRYFVKIKEGFAKAKQLVKSKGIVNLGAGTGEYSPLATTILTDPDVKTNVDIVSGNIPNMFIFDLEKKLPFETKQYDVAFISHTLEHIQNWRQLLNEAKRVADNVVVVLPNPYFIYPYFYPYHKRVFSERQIEEIRKEGIYVYY